MAKKPTEIEPVLWQRIRDGLDEDTLPEPASTEAGKSPLTVQFNYVPPEGYVLVKQADWDEMQRNLKMAR